jgi:hypothetical protein
VFLFSQHFFLNKNIVVFDFALPNLSAADFIYSRAAAAAKCHYLLLNKARLKKQRQIDSLRRGIRMK